MIDHVFVYGTLRQGQCRQDCWPRRPTQISAAYVRGRLFDLGPYPAMLEGTDPVRGEWWTFPPGEMDETLRVLDRIEGFAQGAEADLYQRRVVEIFTSPDAAALSAVRGYAYFLVPERLPAWARRIHPRPHASRSEPEHSQRGQPPGAASPPGPGGIGDGSESGPALVYASWPDDGRTVAETSSLADPFDPVP